MKEEEFDYFISFVWSDGIYQNTQYTGPYINNLKDVQELEKRIQKEFSSDKNVTIINYRIF